MHVSNIRTETLVENNLPKLSLWNFIYEIMAHFRIYKLEMTSHNMLKKLLTEQVKTVVYLIIFVSFDK